MKAAIYARVSTLDQEPENQLQELRRYVQARGWTGTEFVDRGVSGSKDRRPALDQLIADAKRRKFDVVVDAAGRQAMLVQADDPGIEIRLGRLFDPETTEGLPVGPQRRRTPVPQILSGSQEAGVQRRTLFSNGGSPTSV